MNYLYGYVISLIYVNVVSLMWLVIIFEWKLNNGELIEKFEHKEKEVLYICFKKEGRPLTFFYLYYIIEGQAVNIKYKKMVSKTFRLLGLLLILPLILATPVTVGDNESW